MFTDKYGYSPLDYNLVTGPLHPESGSRAPEGLLTPLETGFHAHRIQFGVNNDSRDVVYVVPDDLGTYSAFNQAMIHITCMSLLKPRSPLSGESVNKKVYFVIPFQQVLTFEMMRIITLCSNVLDCHVVRIPRNSEKLHSECTNFSLSMPLGIMNGCNEVRLHIQIGGFSPDTDSVISNKSNSSPLFCTNYLGRKVIMF